MLRLRACIVSHILSSPPTSAIFTLRRLISGAAPAISPNPGFAVDDYLVHTCGLTRAQALKASRQLSHLKSSSKPDAVLAFLSGHGFSSAEVAATVAKYPKLLCAGVERTLAPRFVGLTGLGLSGPDIARLISIVGMHFRLRSVVSKVHFYLLFFRSTENFFRALKCNSYLLGFDLERKIKPNVAILQECVLNACDVAKLCISEPRILSTKPERIRAMVTSAEGLGVPLGSGMFWKAFHAVAFLSEENIIARVDYLKKAFRWSDAEARIAVAKAPTLLQRSKEMLRCKSEFLILEVGLEPAYIAHRPVIICLSLEGRLRPRHYVRKFLKENGFLDCDWSFATVVMITDVVFVEKYICPHKEAAPHLAEDYAAACRGEVPANFRSASTKNKALKIG
uniref:Uncharacterized protein n=1 Tax=Avena sativa TaxID=4498 RepID=A0ACD5Z3N3_AVESA